MRPSTSSDVDRELARAGGARRLLPWALASALAAGLLGFMAGGGWRGGATLFAAGLVLVLFVWNASIARCPGCGARLASKKERPGSQGDTSPAFEERERRCPRCDKRYFTNST